MIVYNLARVWLEQEIVLQSLFYIAISKLPSYNFELNIQEPDHTFDLIRTPQGYQVRGQHLMPNGTVNLTEKCLVSPGVATIRLDHWVKLSHTDRRDWISWSEVIVYDKIAPSQRDFHSEGERGGSHAIRSLCPSSHSSKLKRNVPILPHGRPSCLTAIRALTSFHNSSFLRGSHPLFVPTSGNRVG